MPDEVAFDALELARRANPEIDDVRRMAHEQLAAEQPSGASGNHVTIIVRAFRDLSKGG